MRLQAKDNSWIGETSRIFDDGKRITAGMQSSNPKWENGMRREAMSYGQFFNLNMAINGLTMWVRVDGEATSGVTYDGGRFHTDFGALGIRLLKGRIKIKRVLISPPRAGAASTAENRPGPETQTTTGNGDTAKIAASSGADNGRKPDQENPTAAKEAEGRTPREANRFVPLFNGKTLDGWTIDGDDKGGWSVGDGEIVAHGTGEANRSYLLTDREYSDYVLKVDFSVEPTTWAGIAVLAIPREELPHPNGLIRLNHPMVESIGGPQSGQTGMMLWLSDRMFAVGPDQPATMRTGTEWNTMEMFVHGNLLRIKVNGSQIVETSVPADTRFINGMVPGLCRKFGRIGLQKHTGTVRYRNIEVMELPSSSASQEIGVQPASGPVAHSPVSSPQFPLGQWVDVLRSSTQPAQWLSRENGRATVSRSPLSPANNRGLRFQW